MDKRVTVQLGKDAHVVAYDPSTIGPGKLFTKKQKDKIREANKAANRGKLRSDSPGNVELLPPEKNVPGVAPPNTTAEADHIIARAKGVINTCANAQVLSREENGNKSDD